MKTNFKMLSPKHSFVTQLKEAQHAASSSSLVIPSLTCSIVQWQAENTDEVSHVDVDKGIAAPPRFYELPDLVHLD